MYIVKDGISDFMTSCYPPHISALFSFSKNSNGPLAKSTGAYLTKRSPSTSQVGPQPPKLDFPSKPSGCWGSTPWCEKPWKQKITIFNKKYIFRFSWIFQLVMLVSRHVTNIYQYFCCRNYVLVVCLAWKKSLSIFQWGLRIHSSNVNLTVRPWK